jgi:hypothetical protein
MMWLLTYWSNSFAVVAVYVVFFIASSLSGIVNTYPYLCPTY